MSPQDLRLICAAAFGIGLSIWLIVKLRLHAFVGLLCGAFAVGLTAGMSTEDTARAVQKGVGDILGGTGLVVALGLSLAAMLQLSNGAASLARTALRFTGPRAAPWACLAVAMVVGLPLFFETGLVLLLPIVAVAAANLPERFDNDAFRLRMMLSALAGLGALHALVPPHPGPLLAISALGANLGRTMVYGVLIAIPTAILAGPVLAVFTSRRIRLAQVVVEPTRLIAAAPPNWASLAVILAPVVLISAGQVHDALPSRSAPSWAWLAAAGNPVLALLITNLAALPLLFGRKAIDAGVQGAIWAESMRPAGALLLAIGAGGGLKQVLVSAGLSDLLARSAAGGLIPPILLAWLVAVCIRLAAGSATVATITTAGIMPKLVASTGVAPEWIVLAIGAGSVFFSHVNDPGFWLVKGYLGTSTADTFRTWSLLETVISVVGLVLILGASAVWR